LIQFALLGSSDLEQYAILLVRVSLGLFFAISGANKCLLPAARERCTKRSSGQSPVSPPDDLFRFRCRVRWRSLLVVGFLSSLAGGALLVDMLVAILTTKFPPCLKTFASSLARRFPLPSGSPVRALLYLATLLWSGKVQCRLLARRQVAELIDRRSSLLLLDVGLPRGVNAQTTSVNVGLPRDVTWNGKTVRTAIWKTPVVGRQMVRKLDIVGDAQLISLVMVGSSAPFLSIRWTPITSGNAF